MAYTRKVTVRLQDPEFEWLVAQVKKSTCRKLSEYIRKVLLQKPVVITYRNASADAFLAEMVQLKNELSALGNNFNQVVHKLHTLATVSEFKAWLMLNETRNENFLKKTEEIRLKLNQIHEQWSQK